MRVGAGAIVTADYTLRLESGRVVDASDGRGPLGFRFGRARVTPEVGMRLTVQGCQGQEMPFTIVAVSEEQATLDFDHHLAGENLTFAVTVQDVRLAGGGRIILPGEA